MLSYCFILYILLLLLLYHPYHCCLDTLAPEFLSICVCRSVLREQFQNTNAAFQKSVKLSWLLKSESSLPSPSHTSPPLPGQFYELKVKFSIEKEDRTRKSSEEVSWVVCPLGMGGLALRGMPDLRELPWQRQGSCANICCFCQRLGTKGSGNSGKIGTAPN